MASGKKLALQFFELLEGTTWICKCGIKRELKGNGYTNLCSHIHSEHRELLPLTDEEVNKDKITKFLYSKTTKDIHGWLHYIIMRLLPFSEVNNKYSKEFSKFGPISKMTLMKYMKELTTIVEVKISKELPDQFSCVFDGWTSGSEHYVALLFAYPDDKSSTGYRTILAGFSPMGDGDSQNADAHITYIEFVLRLFGKWWDNVVAITGDNCATNVAIANKVGIPFVGCASHRFNLAVQDIITTHDDLMDKVNNLMRRLKYAIPASKLRKFTDLRAKTKNVTRWSSTYKMLLRYTEIKSHLHALQLLELEPLIPTLVEDKRIEGLVKILADLNSVTVVLQSNATNLAMVRDLFDEIITVYSSTKNRLSANAAIVQCPQFESAIVKIQNDEVSRLTPAETDSVAKFQVVHDEEAPDLNAPLAERLLKKRRQFNSTKYLDTRFILATSNVCERMFSVAGYTMGERRHRLLPSNFEMQLFLNYNCEFWSIEDVNKVRQ